MLQDKLFNPSDFRNVVSYSSGTNHEWARFGIYLTYQCTKKIRDNRLLINKLVEHFKEDSSPVTILEEGLEEFIVKSLNEFNPSAGFIGEELGSINPDAEIVIVVDPIDGTWSFLSGFNTYAFTLSILKNKTPIFSSIGVPSSGEISFRINKDPSKIVQIPLGIKYLNETTLPILPSSENDSRILTIHSSRLSNELVKKAFDLWEEDELNLVRVVSGSPSLHILEIAKGKGIYYNIWGKGNTQPFDLIAAAHLLEGAGGLIMNMDHQEANLWEHSGPFIACRDIKYSIQIISKLQNKA